MIPASWIWTFAKVDLKKLAATLLLLKLVIQAL